MRHNDLRDITAGLLSRVCSDVATEPPLQPLSGEVSLRTDRMMPGQIFMHVVSGDGDKVPFLT